MNAWGSRVVTCATVALALTGCTKQRSTMGRPPAVNPPPAVESNVEVRVDELAGLSKQFSETARQLPGRNAEEDRAALRQAFTELAQILPILYGPNPDGAQRQQLRIVESARTQLASPAQGLALEPTVDTALRAARDALESLGRRSYFDQQQIGQTLDRLDAKVTELDAARGAAHPQAVARSVELMSAAITQMSDALNERLEDQNPADRSAP
jgi:hypothetical protein